MRTIQFEQQLKWLKDNPFKRNFSRDYEILIDGKNPIIGSADKHFFGNKELINPEDQMISAVSACHMLSFLYVCHSKSIEVLSYQDTPKGFLNINQDGSGEFSKIELYPNVVFSNPVENEKELHSKAHQLCFIARSCNFPIEIEL